jgi:serpin B
MCGPKLDAPGAAAHSEGMAFSFAAFASPRFRRVSLRSALETFTYLGAAAALGCGGGQTGDEHTGGLLQELRGTAPRVAANGAGPNAAAEDNWDFGWRFYAEEARPNDNVFFSPYSISVASAMLVAGAAGETKTEIDAALSFTNDTDSDFHQARNTLAQVLERRNRAASEERNAQSLRVSNDLWMNKDFRPLPAYLNTLSAYYGVGTFLAPFDTDAEAARQAINAKVANDTEQLIPELLPQGSVDDARFVLTNALYFKARWEREFSKSATRDQAFTNGAGAAETVPMMHNTLTVPYAKSAEYEVIALPYSGRELELVAIMPLAGTFANFITGLSAERAASITSSVSSTYVDLSFPKFGITSKVPLVDRLKALGMLRAFEEGQADFSNLSDEAIYLDAFHDATLKLDEEGTEAAAATAFVGIGTSAPPTPTPVVFDHPFVFFIRDSETNTLLFVGHFANP